VYDTLTGFSRISHRCSDGQNLLHFGTEEKDNIAVSAESSVAASLVGSLTECLIRVATDVKWQALPEQVKQLHLICKSCKNVTTKSNLSGLHGPNGCGPVLLQKNDNSMIYGSYETLA
jgi:hypothetical protein